MDPIDFLALVFSDPLQTFSEFYGIQSVILFWIGVFVVSFSLAGLFCSTELVKKMALLKMRSAQNVSNSSF